MEPHITENQIPLEVRSQQAAGFRSSRRASYHHDAGVRQSMYLRPGQEVFVECASPNSTSDYMWLMNKGLMLRRKTLVTDDVYYRYASRERHRRKSSGSTRL